MNQAFALAQMPWLQTLPHHAQALASILEALENYPGFQGAFVAGSLARGQMDVYSDLDLGLVFETPAQRDEVWAARYDWPFASFHRVDADHIKDYFVIHFLEPAIKADIGLYHPEDLPSAVGAPYRWVSPARPAYVDALELLETPGPTDSETERLAQVVHDDERFWARLFYVWQHTARGEMYGICSDFAPLREICERWASWLYISATAPVNYRDFERKLPWDIRAALARSFPAPERMSIKRACESLMALQLKLRDHWTEEHALEWKSSPEALKKIRRMYDRL